MKDTKVIYMKTLKSILGAPYKYRVVYVPKEPVEGEENLVSDRFFYEWVISIDALGMENWGPVQNMNMRTQILNDIAVTTLLEQERKSPEELLKTYYA